jgi:hypothetical protein
MKLVFSETSNTNQGILTGSICFSHLSLAISAEHPGERGG